MPLRQTNYGYECPIGKFDFNKVQFDRPTQEMLRNCQTCYFANSRYLTRYSTDFPNMDIACRCPSDLEQKEYQEIFSDYAKDHSVMIEQTFIRYVNKHRRKS